MNYKIHQGDNRVTLKTLEDNSIDAIVTDPPYGIDFLGKAWDANTGALETYQECLRVLKPGGYILAFSAARTYHHLAVTLEQAGFEIRDQLMWLYSSGFPKAQDIGKAIDKRAGKKDPTYGTTKHNVTSTEGKGSGGQLCNVCNRGIGEWTQLCTKDPCGLKYNYQTTEAEQWAGWKTALKPAHEPICMARKPFKGSTIDNVLTHGVGALNVDASRVPFEDLKAQEKYVAYRVEMSTRELNNNNPKTQWRGAWDENAKADNLTEQTATEKYKDIQGRFPSNVIGEVEGYQKFFYCPKVSRKERHVGFDDPSNKFKDAEKGVGNNHPTVKPVELMKYLIKLVTPPNSTVLDPFCGSGSTGIAATELGHAFIGCELDPAYIDIANTRIAAWNCTGLSKELFE